MNFVVFGIPFHFCQHEMLMITGVVAVIPFVGSWIKSKFRAQHKKDGCEHGEHG